MSLDHAELRREFPLLARKLDGRPITYLDSASTAPRPRAVLEALRRFHGESTANVHRGVHALAAEASEGFEAARHTVAAHLGASASEIVFTSGTTDAVNLIADAFGFEPGDEVLATVAEHHSNLLPWRRRANVRLLPLAADGRVDFGALQSSIGPRTKLVALHHASNVLGTLAPLADLAPAVRARGAALFVDGAQAAGHLEVDVRALGADFFAFSGHKLGGPSGIGALWAKSPWLERLAPQRWGGGMVAKVGERECEWKSGPQRFEAGTPNVEGALGLAAALEFLRGIGCAQIAEHGRELARLLLERCAAIPGVRVLGSASPEERIPLVALTLPARGLDAETVARTLSDTSGILVSAGRHCAHPLHDALGIEATLRASAWIHNDADDVERFAAALRGLVA